MFCLILIFDRIQMISPQGAKKKIEIALLLQKGMILLACPRLAPLQSAEQLPNQVEQK